ncbi:3-hydroxyacyl-ACP dehydratase FabZ [Leucothrix mucor]|uniref:3-hydroxyacyl-ACP dehydratase FabZ n=1 Tax=Leucothrix mucor TaxID=45248 RepID=UPI0003B339B5|nr:3-hydroxyacyl-ACP dehydratase FabZ [Leucothrix mucor]
MKVMDVVEIRKFLAHRYPFLLVDRVLDYEEGKYLKAIKNVSINEPFFNGHFPDQPIMPGVLLIEAMAQATGLLGFLTMGTEPQEDTLYILVGVNNVRFRKQVVPGDQVELHAELVKRKGTIWFFKTEAKVDGKTVTSAELMCAVVKEGA